MDGLHEQLKEHYKWFILESSNGYQNIFPNTDWTKEEYDELFTYIDKGWLIAADTVISNGFIINEDWEGEHLWKPEKEKTEYHEEKVAKKCGHPHDDEGDLAAGGCFRCEMED